MTTQPGFIPPTQHLVLAAIEDGVRAVSIRVLGAYAESLGVRTTLLIIVKDPASVGRPLIFSPREVRQIAEFLRRERVTHFGMYLMTATLKPYRLLVKALRDADFDGVILAGGVHATLGPEESLADGADFAVQGPGEVPLRMILERAEPATIPGLVWRRENAVVITPQSPEHFSSIAGAGPIVGPIIAAVGFGWAVPLVWVLVGAIFMTAATLYALVLLIQQYGLSLIGVIAVVLLALAVLLIVEAVRTNPLRSARGERSGEV